MNFRPEITSAVLLGTGRGVPDLGLPGDLKQLTENASPELRLLRVAGILSLAHGVTTPAAVTTSIVIEQAAEETGNVASDPALVSLLTQIVDGGKAAVIKEACELLAKSAFCLPPRLLPRALALGAKSSALREPLRSVLGKRGAWLAAQNSEWKFALLAGAESMSRKLWDEGDVSQRTTYLAALRKSAPSEARQLLETSFAAETARDRVVLVPTLAIGLSPADETFLSTLLQNDRSKEVRQIAAALLSRLPESAFAKRMTNRLDGLVRSEKKLIRTVTTIEPPKEFGADWAADTLEQKPPAHLKIGERAWWLQQLVSLTPVEWWEQRLKMTPSDILAIASKSEWKQALLEGFRIAATTPPRNDSWVLALLENGKLKDSEAASLALNLPAEQADLALRKLLADSDDSALAAQVIEAADFVWSEELWRATQKKLPRWLDQQDWRFRSALELLASRVPVSALNYEPQWPDVSLFSESFAEFSRVLDQRRRLYQLIK